MNKLIYACMMVAVFAQLAWSQQVLTVHNDMNDAVYFSLKSETKPDSEWKSWLIGRGRSDQYKLFSPDRFEIAATDLQGNEYYADLMPLRQMLRDDPRMVLELSGIFQTHLERRLYYSPRNGYYYRNVTRTERAAIVFHFVSGDGDVTSVVAQKIKR